MNISPYPGNESELPRHVTGSDQRFPWHQVHLPELQHQLVQELQVAALEQHGVTLDDVAVLVAGHLHAQRVRQGSEDPGAV